METEKPFKFFALPTSYVHEVEAHANCKFQVQKVQVILMCCCKSYGESTMNIGNGLSLKNVIPSKE